MMYRSSAPRVRGRFPGRRLFARPSLEVLEDRLVPTGLGWVVDADPQPTLNAINNWGLAVDGNNNSIITGPFTGTTIVGSVTLTSAGAQDGYIAKYDGNGSFLWVKTIRGTGDDTATRVATDASGNIYVAGYFASATATFGTLTQTNSTGYKAAFVAKLDASGNFLWVTPFRSTTGDDSTWGVAVDGNGNVYATGYFTGATSFGSTTLNSAGGAGGQNIFVTKLDGATGTPLWAKRMGGTLGNNHGFGVVPDRLGNVYVTGRFSSTPTSPATFGSFSLTSKSPGGTNPMTSATNAFVTRLDSLGNFQWAQRMGGEGDTLNTAGYGIALDDRAADPSTWAVYVTGSMYGNSCDFGSTTFTTYGNDDAFVARLSATTGSFSWADQLGGAGQDMGWAIALDGAGNVYTTGGFGANNQSANFDPHGTFLWYPGNGISSPNDISSSRPQSLFREAYVSMLDPNGNFRAAWQTTAAASGGNGAGGIASIASNSAGDIWVSGGFSAPTTFPTGQTLSNNGAAWVFLMRLNAPHGGVVGTVYADLNNNGTRNAEPPLAGRTVYADLNNNGALDSGEASTVTNLRGYYELNGLLPGTYTIRTVLPAGWTGTTPAGGVSTVTVGNGFTRKDFGEYTATTQTTYTQNKPTSIKRSPFGDEWAVSTLSISDSYSLLDVNVNLDISYSPVRLLRVYLIAPDGRRCPWRSITGAAAPTSRTRPSTTRHRPPSNSARPRSRGFINRCGCWPRSRERTSREPGRFRSTAPTITLASSTAGR